jgi:site-specific DNA recombinase
MPRHAKSSSRRRSPDEWIYVSVPPIVSEDLFLAAAEQLKRNLVLAQRNARPERCLVSGLTVCALCGYGYCGRTNAKSARYTYAYYKCAKCSRGRFSDGFVCSNRSVRADQLDQHVWQSVRELLEDPDRVMQEWIRRSSTGKQEDALSHDRDDAARAILVHERALKRLVDAFEAGVLDLAELKQRSERVRARIEHARKDVAALDAALAHKGEMKLVVNRLQQFARQIHDSLDQLSWHQRRDIIRAVVKRIEIDAEAATIVYRVPVQDASPETSRSSGTAFADCNGGTSVPMTRLNSAPSSGSSGPAKPSACAVSQHASTSRAEAAAD